MRAIWSGSIGFGLVNIPIKLYSAIETNKLDFDMLDKADHENIKYKRVNEKTGKEVPWSNIVKGYLYNDKYVIVESEDFEKASPEKTQHIDIVQFVLEDDIDSVYFETPYFIEAQKSGVRAYKLLFDALKKTGKAGVGSFVMRDKEHVCIIKVYEDVLVLNRIRYDAEIRETEEIKTDGKASKPAEIKMAINLIEQLTEDFDPTLFKDEYTDKLLKIIKAKAKGKKTAVKPMKVVHNKAADLMEQLKASLAADKKKAS